MLFITSDPSRLCTGSRACCINRWYGTVKHWKWCTWYRKASAKNSSKLNKFLHSEVNLLIQHIIVQDQDGQNNNKCNNIIHSMTSTRPKQTSARKINTNNILCTVGLGGLGVTCSPQDPRFAGSNPAEVDGFFQDVKILSTILLERL